MVAIRTASSARECSGRWIEQERTRECVPVVNQESEKDSGKTMVRCPVCRKEVPFAGNPYRPFCSRACKGLDLIRWASENYRIEGKNDEDDRDENAD